MPLTRDLLKSLLRLGDTRAGIPEAHTFLRPDGPGPHPAVLYCHAHGGNYTIGRRELTEGRPCLHSPYSGDLLEAGFAVLCIDMPCFGDRQGEGTEDALSKAGLWHGRPLFGQMIGEQLAAFDWLSSHPETDRLRVATLGISMGAALAMWVAAVERRVSACVQLCMLADMDPLIRRADGHDRHGHYLTVPGLLGHGDMGDVAALIAPRPQFVAHGALDDLTPPDARDAALRRVNAAYRPFGSLETFLSPDHGHFEPPELREAVMDFLLRNLVSQPNEMRIEC